MADDLVSIDEFLSARKDTVKGSGILMKASKAPSSWNADKRTARFVMSAEVEDRDRDIVVQAGIDLDGFTKNPVAPFAHQSRTFPVGTWSDIEKVLTGRPKRTEGTLNVLPEGTDQLADRLAAHIGAGTIRACSIGFVPKAVRKRDVPEDKKNEPYYWPGYSIDEAELVECSPCLIPANPAAFAKDAKGDDLVLGREIVEDILDNWAKHPETGLIVPRAEFEAAYKLLTTPKTHHQVSVATDEQTSGEATPAAEAPQSSPAQEHGLVRRAINVLLGKGSSNSDEDAAAIARAMIPAAELQKAQERHRRAEAVVVAMKRIQRQHDVRQRLSVVKSRVEAHGIK